MVKGVNGVREKHRREDNRWLVIARREKEGKKIQPLENGRENEDSLSLD